MTKKPGKRRGPSPAGAGSDRKGPSRVVGPGRGASALLLGLAILAVAASLTGPIINNDLGFHLRIGEEIASSLRPPLADYHSYTAPGAFYPDHEWLSQLALYGVHSLGGVGGMVALRAILIGLALVLVAASVRGPVVLRLALVLAVFFLALDHAFMRPHVFSWVMFALLGFLLSRNKNWPLPLLLVAWANCHASVVLAAVLACLHFGEEYRRSRDRVLLIWGAACMVAPLIRPHAIATYNSFFRLKGHIDFITEWRPYTPEMGAFWLLIAVVGLAALGFLKRRPLNPFDGVRVVILGALSFQSSRNGVVAAVLLAPLIGRWFGRAVSRWPSRVQYVSAVSLAAIPLALLGWRMDEGRVFRFQLDHIYLPVAAVRFIETHELAGPMFNDYNFGGYMLWKLWPEHPVFVDGRVEVYRGKALDDYLEISQAEPGWEELVRRYGITFFVVRPERRITQALLTHDGWDLVYFDYNSAIFVPRDLFPHLQRIEAVSPYGGWDPERLDRAVEELYYLVEENPFHHGGHKLLAVLLYQRGDHAEALASLRRYLELRPGGIEFEDTRSLLATLERMTD